MNHAEVRQTISDHIDLIGAVVAKTAAKYTRVSPHDLEDMIENAVVYLSEGRLAKWNPNKKRSLRGWIAMVCEQSVISDLRKMRHRPIRPYNHTDCGNEEGEPSVGAILPEPGPSPLDALIDKDNQRRLDAAVSRLSDKDQALFRAICDETVSELGLTPVQLCRARARLIANIRAGL